MARPSFHDYVDNWRASDAPIASKCRTALLNTVRRLKTHHCCGHPGEPGC